MNASVTSINVGRAGVLTHGRREIRSAFVKQPVAGPVEVTRLGLSGDEHVYEDHGGPDMALLAYPEEHYAHWQALGIELPPTAAMAENLTTRGLLETEVALGDTFAIGSAVVQVSQPRSPCFKLAARYGRRSLPVEMQQTGFTGFLLRVLSDGHITAGDEVRLLEPATQRFTVAEAAWILNVDRRDLDGARRLLEVPSLGSVSRTTLEARLDVGGHAGEDTDRLYLDD